MNGILDAENVLEIKKSKFIAVIKYIDKLDDVGQVLTEIKVKYPKATHYTYAYRIDNKEYSTDDKEPSGTAGLPILNVLQKNNIINCICVVIRYFGGIKLGAGPLTRAYSKSAIEVLKKSSIYELTPGYKVLLKFDYSDEKEITNILKPYTIVNKEYDVIIRYTILIPTDEIKKLAGYDYEILASLYIKK